MISFGRTLTAFLLCVSMIFTGVGYALGAPLEKQTEKQTEKQIARQALSKTSLKACMIAAQELGEKCCCCAGDSLSGIASCGCDIAPAPAREESPTVLVSKTPTLYFVPYASPQIVFPEPYFDMVLPRFQGQVLHLPNAPPITESPPRAPPR
jgi:hypothetical protein